MPQLPAALLYELQGLPGYNAASFEAAHRQAPPVSIRLNPFKPSNAAAGLNPVPWCPEGRYLPQRPVFTLDPLFHAGAYYVQEASSMFLDHAVRTLLPERSGLRVLDLCAAPGGKSTLLASLLPTDSLLISNEVIRSRASILEENISRWGLMNTWVSSNDARDFGKLQGYFDLIVVDAPCSGSGLFRKDPDALAEWSEANVNLCSQRQQRILADVWPALKENGILIYATCSYSAAEDEAILDWMSDQLHASSCPLPLQENWGVVASRSARGLEGYRFYPDRLMGEGFFLAALRKTDAATPPKPARWRSAHDRKMAAASAQLLRNGDWLCLPAGKEGFNALHPAHEADMQLIRQNSSIYLRRVGLPLGQPAGKDWIPAHDVALSIDASPELPALELDRTQALRFLKKEEISLAEGLKGWRLMRYQGLGLGWIKALGSRSNNYLPKNLRIRMELDQEPEDAKKA